MAGLVPVVPTIFHDDETLDLDGLKRVVDYLADSGVQGLCALANYSEQFSLTDSERDLVARTVLEHTAGRLPVTITTSHYSARITAERSRKAQDLGAAMVMVMPPFFGATMTVPPEGVIEYFERVASAIEIPVMVQDAPLSPTPLPVPVLRELIARVPQVTSIKVEVPAAADKLAALRGCLPGLFDGEESVTLIPDLDAGATGSMPSSMVPAELASVLRHWSAGDRPGAADQWERLLPLIHFENRQCGLRAQKILLREGGIIGSALTRAPLAPVSPRTERGLVDLARSRNPLVLRWARLRFQKREAGRAQHSPP
jgi:2-keto-3-deoxy-L-arabinonate dehydratase